MTDHQQPPVATKDDSARDINVPTNTTVLPEYINLRDNVVLPLLNEVLRRHDHKPDAHLLDAKLFVDAVMQYGIDQRKAMGARLNRKIFFSTTQPDGQLVKDCIIEELNRAESDQLTALKSKETPS